MPQIITFDESTVPLGTVTAISRAGVVVTFADAQVVTAPVATRSGSRCCVNTAQNLADETGFQKPMVIRFDRLQRTVTVAAGLEHEDFSVSEVFALLTAQDSAGRIVASDSRSLGRGPTPVTMDLHVDAGSDAVARILISYSGNNRECIDDLRFDADADTAPPPDIVPPLVHIDLPHDNALLHTSSTQVAGRVVEAGPVTVTVNGSPASVRPDGLDQWRFSGTTELVEGTSTITAEATDAAGNRGHDQVRVTVVEPVSVTFSDVQLTQSGIFDDTDPLPTRLVAHKTTMLRARVEARSAAGTPVGLDGAVLRIDGGPDDPITVYGQPVLTTTTSVLTLSRPVPFDDGSQLYFLVPGDILGSAPRFTLTLAGLAGTARVSPHVVATNLHFREVGSLTLLLQPQQHACPPEVNRSMLTVLHHTARIYPVRDGIAALDSDDPGGVRFAVVAPADHTAHLDPADDASLSYADGYLLNDHDVSTATGPDGVWGTADDDRTKTHFAGEYIGPVNFTTPQDENRDGVISGVELDHVQGGDDSPARHRVDNWSAWIRQQAEAQRVLWNQRWPHRPWRLAFRAIGVVTNEVSTGMAQNWTPWQGNAGNAETSYWAGVGDQPGAFIAHETGHTLGFPHKEDCMVAAEGVDLITGQIFRPAAALMCPDLGLGQAAGLFITPDQYNGVYDRLVAGTLGAGAGQLIEPQDVPTVLTGFVVQLTATPAGAASILAVWPDSIVDSAPVASDGVASSDGLLTVVLLDAAGGELGRRAVDPVFSGDGYPVPLGSAHAQVSVATASSKDVVAVEVRHADTVVARLDRTADASVTAEARMGAGNSAAPRLSLTWATKNAVAVACSYCADADEPGETWTGLAPSGGLDVAVARAPGPKAGVEFTATNGFTVSTCRIELGIEAKPAALPPPDAAIVNAPARPIGAGAELTLIGAALDVVTGAMPDARLQWLLDDGTGHRSLGVGSRVRTGPLEPGKHSVLLVATTTDGRVATASAVLEVQPRPALSRRAPILKSTARA